MSDIVTLEEAISILEEHLKTGKPVLRITAGRHLEVDLLAQVLESCRTLSQQNKELKVVLKNAMTDMECDTADCRRCAYDKEYCPAETAVCEFKWRYADIAYKLLHTSIDKEDSDGGIKPISNAPRTLSSLW